MMATEGPDKQAVAEGRDQISTLDEQERALRKLLGSEHDFLVDLVHAGMDAADFRRSRTGKIFLEEQSKLMSSALAVLADPTKDDKATLAAAYQLRVAYASTMSILETIVAGTMAEQNIDRLT